MADLSITASEVLKTSANANTEVAIAGEEVTAGVVVYKKAADSKMWKADANVDAATATAVGITLNHAYADQPVSIQKTQTITIGSSASVAEGVTYVVSATAGAICPDADITSGIFKTILGVGNGADGIDMSINASGEQIA